MKWLALLIGVLMICLGLTGMVAPVILFDIAREGQAPPWLYVAAGARVAIGFILYWTAPRCRAPTAMVVVGAVIFTSGLLTPFAGTGAAQLILDWWNTAGPIVVRAFALLAITIGGFVVYAFAPWPKR